MLENLLQQAIDLLQDGNKAEAQKMLQEIIKANPQYENAWLWYAFSLENPSEKIQVLQKCLEFIPTSVAAQQTLDELLNPPINTNQDQSESKITLRLILSKTKPYFEIFSKWFSQQEGVVKAAVVSVLGLFITGCFGLITAFIIRPAPVSPVIIIPTAIPTPTAYFTPTPSPDLDTQPKPSTPLFVPPKPILELLDSQSQKLSSQMRMTLLGAIGGILSILGLWQVWLIFFNKSEKNKNTIFSSILIAISLLIVWQLWGWFALLIGVIGSLGLAVFVLGLIFSAILHVPYLGGSIVGATVGAFLGTGGCFIYFTIWSRFNQEELIIALIAGTAIGSISGLLFSSFNNGEWNSPTNVFQNT